MAKQDSPLHDNPRSPRAKGKQVAEKGDVRSGRELGILSGPGSKDDYESVGHLKGKGGTKADSKDVEGWDIIKGDEKGEDAEVWRRRRPVPTS